MAKRPFSAYRARDLYRRVLFVTLDFEAALVGSSHGIVVEMRVVFRKVEGPRAAMSRVFCSGFVASQLRGFPR